jgi:hypothetical protein
MDVSIDLMDEPTDSIIINFVNVDADQSYVGAVIDPMIVVVFDVLEVYDAIVLLSEVNYSIAVAVAVAVLDPVMMITMIRYCYNSNVVDDVDDDG